MQPDIQINDLQLRLDPATGRIPFSPLVTSMHVDISQGAFEKAVRAAVVMAGDRVPVDLTLASANLVNGGAEIVARVKRSILKADVKAHLEFTAISDDTIRVRVAKIDAPAWVPTQFVIEQGMGVVAAKAGFARAADDPSALDVKPADVLARRGIPVKLAAPGSWSIDTAPDQMRVRFASR